MGPGKSILLDEYREQQDSLPLRRRYAVGDFVIVFNPLTRSRDEPVCIRVDSLNAYLKDDSGKEIRQQISPIFELKDGKLVASSEYELCFVDDLKAFGVKVYEVLDSFTSSTRNLAAISAKTSLTVSGFEITSTIGNEFTLINPHLSATFDGSTGYLKSVTPKGHTKIDVNIHYVHYGARRHGEGNVKGADNLSGAYLFLPDGEAKEIAAVDQDVVVVDGPIMRKVFVAGPTDLKILQVYSIWESSPSVEIANEVDIQSKSDFELAMRLVTNIQSGDDLYTDLNGIQFIRRRRMIKKLPLQAHFYPMPASAYIEDTITRLSLLGAQALGVASLKPGELEVMLDRRLMHDDGRGLDQGVLDNHRTLSRFRLLIEPLSSDKDSNNERVGFYSPVGLSQSMEIHYPVVRMVSQARPKQAVNVKLAKSLPCDVHMVTLRTMASPTNYEGNRLASPRNQAALVVYRPFTDCRSKLQLRSDCTEEENTVTIKKLFPTISSSTEASLTLLYEGKEKEEISLEPQDIITVKLSW
ncbi:hypothetical protein KIN20_004438 [Parelaphostrongylus tenuis]|uniref:Glycosyl hydrolase family 38 C-terminal domain-containing protein n=1 Tax=Parelaphostrongylus tenuis TaxID=148309 RepID=A0AAD5MHA4_PARTN|nr:hypothetical protein KIN20_004438 [Parelaphostrongylus tenuis]